MRILHTSDWHLGTSTGNVSRLDEQRAFLEWLLKQLDVEKIDVLLLAGDVFDTMHPSAEAQELYYHFLVRVGQTGVRDVVIIGGNHDSASRLDAPRPLLRSVGVHVIGGLPKPDDRARMCVPLRARGSDEVVAVCLAVPYVHEYRLGVRTSNLDIDQTRAAFREAFTELYQNLADEAQRQFPGVPLVAMGHLTLGTGSTKADYPHEIHQVGTIEGLPLSVIDERISYMALGHIHRSFPLGESLAWYSGSPIPYSLTEMQVDRRVLVVELAQEGAVTVHPISVPVIRELVEITGSVEVVVQQVYALQWTTPSPPLLHVQVLDEELSTGLRERLQKVIEKWPDSNRPIIVELKQRCIQTVEELIPVVSLETLSPADVFALMCRAKRPTEEVRERLSQAFSSILSADDDVFEGMLNQVDQNTSGRQR